MSSNHVRRIESVAGLKDIFLAPAVQKKHDFALNRIWRSGRNLYDHIPIISRVKDEETARPEDAIDLSENGGRIGHMLNDHIGRKNIERTTLKRQIASATQHLINKTLVSAQAVERGQCQPPFALKQ